MLGIRKPEIVLLLAGSDTHGTNLAAMLFHTLLELQRETHTTFAFAKKIMNRGTFTTRSFSRWCNDTGVPNYVPHQNEAYSPKPFVIRLKRRIDDFLLNSLTALSI